MKLRFKDILTSGVLPKQNFREKRDIIFLNQASFILMLCMLCIFLANISFGYYSRSLVSLSLIPFLGTVIYLQKIQKYYFAKGFIIAAVLTAIFLTTFLFGGQAKTAYYMFASFCLSIVIFSQRKEHLITSVIHLCVFCSIFIYSKYYPPIFSGQDSVAISYFHLPLIFFCIFIVLSEYGVHNKRYENRINDLMNNLQEHGELLEVEKTKFEVQTEILQMTNDQLLVEIAQREAVKQELMESNESLEQFAYVASHDLKEPLRTIGSFSQLLKRKLADKLDEETGEYFHFVVNGVQRMSNLLDNLLAFSRLNREPEIVEVNLDNCLELNKLKLNNTIENNNGTIIIDPMPIVKASRTQMNQLFQNLMSNGLKFRKEEAPVVRISCKEEGDDFLFSVEDNGIGIPEEFQEKIFVIFQRLEEDAKFEGTGIGLAICKKIVQNHRGDIWLESTPGKGTTFYFTIPKAGGYFPAPDDSVMPLEEAIAMAS